MSRHELINWSECVILLTNAMCVRIKACIMSFLTQNDDAQGIKVHSYQLAIQYFTDG